MWPNLVTFTDKILNGKLHFLWRDTHRENTPSNKSTIVLNQPFIRDYHTQIEFSKK